MEELKACPFCGSEAKLMRSTIVSDLYVVYCNNQVDRCEVEAVGFPAPEAAIEWWNRRAVEDGLRAEIERLRALLPKAFLTGISYVGVTGNPPPSEYFADWLAERAA